MSKTDDFRRFELECPSCRRELSEWMERCPYCGQNLFEVYSGTYRGRRGRWGRWLVVFILLMILVGLVRLVFQAAGR